MNPKQLYIRIITKRGDTFTSNNFVVKCRQDKPFTDEDADEALHNVVKSLKRDLPEDATIIKAEFVPQQVFEYPIRDADKVMPWRTLDFVVQSLDYQFEPNQVGHPIFMPLALVRVLVDEAPSIMSLDERERIRAMEATLSASHDDGVFNPTDDELGEDEDDSLDLDSMLDVPGSPVDEAPDEPDVTEATKATTPVATEPPADIALPEQKDDSEQLPTKGKRSSRKKQKKDDDTPVTRTNAFQPNAKTQADEEDSSLVEKSIPFQTEAETRKERPKPTRTEHKKSSKTDAQTESLFGRDFQNRTKSGSGGSKKRSSSKKAQTIQSDGEQMRFDESNTDVIKCKV